MVFGTKHTRRRNRSLAAALTLVWLALPAAAWAECTAVDRNDLPRDCTALEELGGCMDTAMESAQQCAEDGSLWGRYRCFELGFIDMAACVLVSPLRTILK